MNHLRDVVIVTAALSAYSLLIGASAWVVIETLKIVFL